MNQYVHMVLFVLVLGLITSFMLVGVDAWTEDRIAINQAAELQVAILDAYEIEYTLNEISTIFEEHVEVIEADGKTFYVDRNTGAVSFIVEGGGVWGPIIGVLSLESDFVTILRITILQEEETPGLGGIISERQYLNNYVGRELEPVIIISRNANLDNLNEVDAITGGTRTSERFEIILNESYTAYKEVWDAINAGGESS